MEDRRADRQRTNPGYNGPSTSEVVVALYKYAQFLVHSNDNAFDTIWKPGEATPHSGIFRCEGCGREVASNGGNPLPPQSHHQHTPAQGAIRWRMVVYAQG